MITVDFNRLSIKPGYRILDMGCGTGRHTCAASRLKGVLAFGSDIRFEEALETRKRLRYEEKLGVQGGGTWATLVADMTSLPFTDDSFDLVICSEVLEHVREQNRAIEEVTRVLKPGRDLVVSVPRYLPEKICWTLSEAYHEASDGHIRIYTRKDLSARLEKAGLRMWACHFAHSLHTPYWWLKCLLGPKREDSRLVNLYHRFLVWDMMKKPRMTHLLDHALNPIMGKSVVFYLRKERDAGSDYASAVSNY